MAGEPPPDFDYAVCNKCQKHFDRSRDQPARWVAKVVAGKLECPTCPYVADDDAQDAARLQPPTPEHDRARDRDAAITTALDGLSGKIDAMSTTLEGLGARIDEALDNYKQRSDTAPVGAIPKTVSVDMSKTTLHLSMVATDAEVLLLA